MASYVLGLSSIKVSNALIFASIYVIDFLYIYIYSTLKIRLSIYVKKFYDLRDPIPHDVLVAG